MNPNPPRPAPEPHQPRRRSPKQTSCAWNTRLPAKRRATSSVLERTANPTSAGSVQLYRRNPRRLPPRRLPCQPPPCRPPRSPILPPALPPRPPKSPAIPTRPTASRLGALRDNGVLLRAHDAQPERWPGLRSEEHTSELQSLRHLVCRLLLEKKTQTEVEGPALRQRHGGHQLDTGVSAH